MRISWRIVCKYEQVGNDIVAGLGRARTLKVAHEPPNRYARGVMRKVVNVKLSIQPNVRPPRNSIGKYKTYPRSLSHASSTATRAPCALNCVRFTSNHIAGRECAIN